MSMDERASLLVVAPHCIPMMLAGPGIIDYLGDAADPVRWVFEGILDVETPVDMIVNAFAWHALWIAITDR